VSKVRHDQGSERPTRALISVVNVPTERLQDMRTELQRWTSALSDDGLCSIALANPLPLEWVEHSMHEIGLLCMATGTVAVGVEKT
jgi:hypothetical protein